jgi:glycine hydroxymethyltransferase
VDTLHDLFDERSLLRNLRQGEAEDECFINLCAFDNVLSRSAARFLGSPLGNRYRIGAFKGVGADPSKSGLLLRGFRHVDELEHLAHEASRALFGGVVSDLRPLSGVHATTSIILAATDPGDTIYSISPHCGGHFATQHIAERAGRASRYLAWDAENHNLDIERIAKQFAHEPPAYILLDHGTPLAPLKVAALRQAAGTRALIDYDASHTLGLIAGGLFQNPLAEGCDILHGNTHKSFPGPQKALIVFNDGRAAQRVQRALDAGLVSSLHTHHLIALCITLIEMQVWAKAYARQMVSNAAALDRVLRQLGYVSDAWPVTQSHVLLLETPGESEGYEWFERLRRARIATNVRPLFGRTMMRLGVQEVTRRGFVEKDMQEIASYIHMAISQSAAVEQIRKLVIEKRQARPAIRYSFDHKGFGAASPGRAIGVAA